MQILTTSLPQGNIGVVYAGATISVLGGKPVFTWSVTGLPDGLVHTGNGVISGTPTELGAFTIAVSVVDGQCQATSSELLLEIWENATFNIACFSNVAVSPFSPLPWTEFVIEELGITGTAGAYGRYDFAAIPAGRYTMRASHHEHYGSPGWPGAFPIDYYSSETSFILDSAHDPDHNGYIDVYTLLDPLYTFTLSVRLQPTLGCGIQPVDMTNIAFGTSVTFAWVEGLWTDGVNVVAPNHDPDYAYKPRVAPPGYYPVPIPAECAFTDTQNSGVFGSINFIGPLSGQGMAPGVYDIIITDPLLYTGAFTQHQTIHYKLDSGQVILEPRHDLNIQVKRNGAGCINGNCSYDLLPGAVVSIESGPFPGQGDRSGVTAFPYGTVTLLGVQRGNITIAVVMSGFFPNTGINVYQENYGGFEVLMNEIPA